MAEVLRVARWRTAVLVATLAGLAALLAGCTAGLLTPDSYQVTGGSEARVGDITISDAMIAYDGPIESPIVYSPGDTADLQATILNEGAIPDRLVSVSSPIARGGEILGEATIPAHHALAAGYTEPINAIALPDTAPIRLLLTELTVEIRAGLTYPVDFTFARAGEVRLALRVANPEVPREGCPLPPNGTPPEVLTAPIGRAPAPPTPPQLDCSSLYVPEPEVQVLDVEGPLTHPTWATGQKALLGFVEVGGRRLGLVDPETGETLRSRAVEGAGENFGLIAEPERVVLPLTGSDRVALLDSGSLEEVGSVGTAPAPSWVAVEEPSTSLFALSEDGSTVTVVDNDLLTEKFRLEVRGGPEAVVEPGDDVDPSFWLVTPDGVTYFSGAERPEPVAARQVPLSHKTFSPNDDSAKSAYLAEEGSSRVELLEGSSRGVLEVAERNDLGETVEHVEALPDEQRVHAVTANEVITMRFDTLEIVKTTEFRSTLERVGLGDVRISDFTVGADHLYLAVEGEPYLVKIKK